MPDLPGGSERRVMRKSPLRIQAKTWNDIMQMLSAWKRSKQFTGSGMPSFETDPRFTVLVENKTGTDIRKHRVMRIRDVSYNPANNGMLYNMRPIVKGATVTSSTNFIAITTVPIEDDKIQSACIGGLVVCKVKMNSFTDEWANPLVDADYLESSASGIARILWFGVREDDASSGDSGGSGADSGSESGQNEDDEEQEEGVYYALVYLIQLKESAICYDGFTKLPEADQSSVSNPGIDIVDFTLTEYEGANSAAYNSQLVDVINQFEGNPNATTFSRGFHDYILSYPYDVPESPDYLNYGVVCLPKNGVYKVNFAMNLTLEMTAYGQPNPPAPLVVGTSVYSVMQMIPVDRVAVPVVTPILDPNGNEIRPFPTVGIPVTAGQILAPYATLFGDANITFDDTMLVMFRNHKHSFDKVITTGDEDLHLAIRLRVGWDVGYPFNYGIVPTDDDSSAPFIRIYVNGLGQGGTGISVKRVDRNCEECVEPESGGSVVESGGDMCCTEELATHPDLTSDSHFFQPTIAWNGENWIAHKIDGGKFTLNCVDGVWTAITVGTLETTIGTNVTCNPFSVDIDTDELGFGHGIITITIA